MRGTGVRGGGSRFLYEPFDASNDRDRDRDRDRNRECDEYVAILRALGTPGQIKQKIRLLEELLEEKRRRDWLLRSVRTVAAWAAAVAAGWFAFKGLLFEVVTGLHR